MILSMGHRWQSHLVLAQVLTLINKPKNLATELFPILKQILELLKSNHESMIFFIAYFVLILITLENVALGSLRSKRLEAVEFKKNIC